MSAAGQHGAVFPMTGALIYLEPARFNGGGLQFGGGIRTTTLDSFRLSPAVGIRYRGQMQENLSNTYGELEAIINTEGGGFLPRVGAGVRRMVEY